MNELYDLYCNDKVLGTLPHEKAKAWLEKMIKADTDQEFTWAIIAQRSHGQSGEAK